MKKSLVKHLSESIGEWVKKNKPTKLCPDARRKLNLEAYGHHEEYFLFNEETGRYEPTDKPKGIK